jgi:pimeloyl-ACP methyl ester carboxylesterase
LTFRAGRAIPPVVNAAGMSLVQSWPPDAAGPPLVLVHGAGGTHRHWPDELRALPGRRVIALDLPGHGGSPGPSLRSVPEYARRVLAALDALAVPSAAVAGHSMGGAIAMTLALEAPARVTALVLVGTGARLRVAPAVLQMTADPAALAAGAKGMCDYAFGSLGSPAVRAEFTAGMLATAPGVAHGDFSACDLFDVMARLGELRAPALVVCGAGDRLTPPKYSEFLRERIPGARLELVAGAGHMVQLEAPARVAELVGTFLATAVPSRATGP